MSNNILAGTYGNEGIHVLSADSDLDRVEDVLDGAFEEEDTNFLDYDSENDVIYTTSQRDEGGGVAAYSIDWDGGELEKNSEATTGADRRPSHIRRDAGENYLLTANYEGSISVIALEDDGSLGGRTDLVEHEGSSTHERQEGPHPHSVNTFSDGEDSYVYVPDLGTDEIMAYRLSDNGQLEFLNSTRVEEGSGPRHMDIQEDTAYVINELEPSVCVYDINPENKELEQKQRIDIPGLSEGEVNRGADIEASSAGDFLYASTRGDDSIAAFEIREDGRLKFEDKFSSEGESPRNISINQKGELMAVANRNSDEVAVFGIDKETGELRHDRSQGLEEPAFVQFME